VRHPRLLLDLADPVAGDQQVDRESLTIVEVAQLACVLRHFPTPWISFGSNARRQSNDNFRSFSCMSARRNLGIECHRFIRSGWIPKASATLSRSPPAAILVIALSCS